MVAVGWYMGNKVFVCLCVKTQFLHLHVEIFVIVTLAILGHGGLGIAIVAHVTGITVAAPIEHIFSGVLFDELSHAIVIVVGLVKI